MNAIELIKLKELRISKNYTYQKMADILAMSKSQYYQIENGTRKLYYDTAIKIAKIFDLKPDDIFFKQSQLNYFIILFSRVINLKLSDDFFKKVEKKTNVDKDTILSLAEKLQNGNMKDKKSIIEVIDVLSKMTGKKVSKEQKEKIVLNFTLNRINVKIQLIDEDFILVVLLKA